MDTYSFRVYQIELSQAGNVSVISSTVRESDTDIVVEEFDPIERSVEFEDNLYKLDNTEMVVSGLPENYFKSYSTADDVDGGNYKPFIAEIRKGPQSSWNSNEVLFHGLIDPSSVRFSQRTERTQFKVWSWDRVISEAGKVPARSVLEADIAEMPDYKDITEGQVTIKVADGDVRRGDIAEFQVETKGPVRSPVRDIRTKPGKEYQEIDVAVPIGDNPDIENKTPDNDPNQDAPFYPDGQGRFTLRFNEKPIEGRDGTSVYDLIYDGEGKRVYLRLTNKNTGNRYILTFEPANNDALVLGDNYRELRLNNTIFLSLPGFDLPDDPSNLRVDFYGKKLFKGIGDSIKFYGRSAYGYDPTDGGTNPEAEFVIAGTDSNGDPEGLIPAIFSLSGSGYLDTLESVVDTFVVPSEGEEDYIEDRQTFPTDLEKSLRAIARSAPVYVNLVPTKDANDPSLPRLEVRVTPRSLAVNQNPDVFDGIVKEWNENVIDEPLNAVKITTEGIGKPEGYGPLAGWYPAQNVGNGTIYQVRNNTILVDYYDPNLSDGDTVRIDGKNEGKKLPNKVTVDSVAGVYSIGGGGINSMKINTKESIPDIGPGVNGYGRARWRLVGSSMPDGDSEVVEFETLTWPSFSGPEIADGDDRVVKDSQLSTVARYYYEFLKQLGAKGSATLEGTYPNIVGEKLEFSVPKYETEEGTEVNRVAYVTKTEVDYEKKETEIEFRRGTFTEPDGSALIPRIEVQDTAFVRSGDTTSVAFDAEKTSAPAGSDYLWEVDTTGDGTYDATASSKYFSLDLGVGNYDWKFTVTTPDGQTRTDTGSVAVTEDPVEDYQKPFVDFDAYEIDGNPRKGRLDVIVGGDGRAPESVYIMAKQSGNLPDQPGVPDASKSYVHENPNATTLSNGRTRYRYTIDLAEGHISEMQGYVQHPSNRAVAPDISEQFQFDANDKPAPSYSWNWEYRSSADNYDLYLVWSGSVDTASVKFLFHQDGDTSTAPNNTVTADGRNGRVKVNGSPISSNSEIAVEAKAFNEPGQTGAEESDSPTFNISSPLGGDSIDTGGLDDRYLLESGDRINGPLEFGSAGEIAEGSGSYLEVLAADGTNSGELHLDTLVVDQLDVTGDINQQNENNLAVEDRWIETNVGGGDQDAGVIVNRSSPDAYLMWDEGTDLFGRRIGSSGTFEPFVLEDGTRWDIDIGGDADTLDGTHLANITFSDIAASRYTDSEAVGAIESHGDALTIDITGDADTVDQYGGNDLAVLAENETITAGWVHKADITLDGASLQTSGAATGFSGSGTVINDDKSWFDNIAVRGSLFASQFEIRKLRFSKGPLGVTVGGGKIAEITKAPADDGNSNYYWVVRFEEPHGFSVGDLVLTQEIDEAAATGESGGGVKNVTIGRQVRGEVFDNDPYNDGGKSATIYARNSAVKAVSGSNYNYSDPQVGDDVIVVGNEDGNDSRDSLLFQDPYGPFIDVLDGIDTFGEWESRSPKVRMGYIGGAPNLSNGTSPSGYGLYGENVYLEGTIVANSGKIADSITIGGTQAKNLAADSDLFSGKYSDLSGTPTLGDVASLNDISSTYIADGAVVTRTVATNSITATEANLSDVFAQTLTLNSGGTIRSSGTTGSARNFAINADGSGQFAAGDVSWGTNGTATIRNQAVIEGRAVTANSFDEFPVGIWHFDDNLVSNEGHTPAGHSVQNENSYGLVAGNNLNAVKRSGRYGGGVVTSSTYTENLFPNPLYEGGISSPHAVGNAISATLDGTSFRGMDAAKVTFDPSFTVDGFESFRDCLGAVDTSKTYTLSAYVRVLKGDITDIVPHTGGGNGSYSNWDEVENVGSGWYRLVHRNYSPGSTCNGIGVDVYAGHKITFYVAGAQIQQEKHSTPFVDGSRSAGQMIYRKIGLPNDHSGGVWVKLNGGSVEDETGGLLDEKANKLIRLNDNEAGTHIKFNTYKDRPFIDPALGQNDNQHMHETFVANPGDWYYLRWSLTDSEFRIKFFNENGESEAEWVLKDSYMDGASLSDFDPDELQMQGWGSTVYDDLIILPYAAPDATWKRIIQSNSPVVESPQSTRISGDNIFSGTISANNGVSKINLNDGTFNFANGGLTYNGSALAVEGEIIANSGDIAGFNIGSDYLENQYSDGKIRAGVLGWGGTTGFGFRGGFGEIQIGERNGSPNFLAYGNGSNFVEIGAGYDRADMGITVMTGGNKVFYTDPNTAYIDNLEVRNGATIDGGVTVSGGFSGDQIDVTDLSAVNTSTGSLDVDGTLTMNGGKITNGNTYRIDDTAIQIKSNSSYTEANAITFVDELQDAPISSSDIGRMWFDSAKDELVVSQNAPASGRLLLRGQNNVDIESQNGPIRFFPENNIVTSGGARVVDIPNTQSYGQDGTGIVLSPYESEYGGDADKNDLEDVMGPNEGLIYTMLYPDGNINLAWAETDSNGNIQNRGNTF